jgi:hypothetical protein
MTTCSTGCFCNYNVEKRCGYITHIKHRPTGDTKVNLPRKRTSLESQFQFTVLQTCVRLALEELVAVLWRRSPSAAAVIVSVWKGCSCSQGCWLSLVKASVLAGHTCAGFSTMHGRMNCYERCLASPSIACYKWRRGVVSVGSLPTEL